MNLVADRYHPFIPSAPSLLFQIPSYNLEGTRRLSYEYAVTQANQVVKDVDPAVLSADQVVVLVNGQRRNQIAYKLEYNYIRMLYYNAIYPYPDIPLPPIGSRVTVVATFGNSAEDRYNHLDLRHVLIQGANPANENTLQQHHGFQGGFRLKHIALSEPKYGLKRYCEYKTGFDYQPPLGFEGLDSFSYCLETEWGQRSDAGCISIQVGVVDIVT